MLLFPRWLSRLIVSQINQTRPSTSRVALKVEVLEPREVPSTAAPAGAAGVYMRIPGGNLDAQTLATLQKDPQLDGVVIDTTWRSVEPTLGVFDFTALTAKVNQWGQAGKKVIIDIMPYGQTIDTANRTAGGAFYAREVPTWVYKQSQIATVSFLDQNDGNQPIALPEVWQPGFATTYMDPMIQALAAKFDGNPYVSYIKIGLGHIGNLTAQPSTAGSAAFLKAGWTSSQWGTYVQTVAAAYEQDFQHTPLMVISETVLVKDTTQSDYRSAEANILTGLAQQRVSIIGIDLGVGGASTVASRIYQTLQGAVPYAQAGSIHIGMGDDWPMWVPLSRQNTPPTVGHNDAFLANTVPYLFGGVNGSPIIPSTLTYLQPPEVLAGDPFNTATTENGFDPSVFKTLNGVREHLWQNDATLYKTLAGTIGGAPATIIHGNPITLSASVTNPGSAILTYTWTITKDGLPYTSGSTSVFQFTPSASGRYVAILTVSDTKGDKSEDTGVIAVT